MHRLHRKPGEAASQNQAQCCESGASYMDQCNNSPPKGLPARPGQLQSKACDVPCNNSELPCCVSQGPCKDVVNDDCRLRSQRKLLDFSFDMNKPLTIAITSGKLVEFTRAEAERPCRGTRWPQNDNDFFCKAKRHRRDIECSQGEAECMIDQPCDRPTHSHHSRRKDRCDVEILRESQRCKLKCHSASPPECQEAAYIKLPMTCQSSAPPVFLPQPKMVNVETRQCHKRTMTSVNTRDASVTARLTTEERRPSMCSKGTQANFNYIENKSPMVSPKLPPSPDLCDASTSKEICQADRSTMAFLDIPPPPVLIHASTFTEIDRVDKSTMALPDTPPTPELRDASTSKETCQENKSSMTLPDLPPVPNQQTVSTSTEVFQSDKSSMTTPDTHKPPELQDMSTSTETCQADKSTMAVPEISPPPELITVSTSTEMDQEDRSTMTSIETKIAWAHVEVFTAEQSTMTQPNSKSVETQSDIPCSFSKLHPPRPEVCHASTCTTFQQADKFSMTFCDVSVPPKLHKKNTSTMVEICRESKHKETRHAFLCTEAKTLDKPTATAGELMARGRRFQASCLDDYLPENPSQISDVQTHQTPEKLCENNDSLNYQCQTCTKRYDFSQHTVTCNPLNQYSYLRRRTPSCDSALRSTKPSETRQAFLDTEAKTLDKSTTTAGEFLAGRGVEASSLDGSLPENPSQIYVIQTHQTAHEFSEKNDRPFYQCQNCTKYYDCLHTVMCNPLSSNSYLRRRTPSYDSTLRFLRYNRLASSVTCEYR